MDRTEDLVRRLQRLDLIHTVSRELNGSLDAEALLPRVLSVVLDAVEAEAGSLWLIRGDKIVCDQAIGGAAEKVIGLELPRGAGIVGSVADKRVPEVILEAEKDPRHVHQVDEATGFRTRSLITVPLVARGESLGALQIINKKGGADERFTAEDVSLVQEIAIDAAAVVKNASLLKTERRLRELRTLLRMSREITSTLDLDRILTTAANILSGTVKFRRCSVVLEREGRPVVAAVSGVERLQAGDPAEREISELASIVRSYGDTIYSPSPDPEGEGGEETWRKPLAAWGAGLGVKAVLAVPLKDDTGTLGLLLMEAAEEDFLEEGQREVVETFANQVAVALRNAELYRHTPLVGFLSRRNEGFGPARAGLLARPWVRWGLAALGAVAVTAVIPWSTSAGGEAEVYPVRRHHLRTEVPLLLAEVAVEEGQSVQADQVLGRLDDAELRIRRSELEAQLTAARAEAARSLASGRSAEARAAEERAGWIAAQRDQVIRRIEACTLRSPVAGMVLTHRPRERVGMILPGGETVLEIAEGGRWMVEVLVPQALILRVREGAELEFHTPARPGVRFRGKVSGVGAMGIRSPSDVAFPVSAVVEDPEGLLRPGVIGRASVALGRGTLFGNLFGGVWRWLRWAAG